jgi:hypothetical protein
MKPRVSKFTKLRLVGAVTGGVDVLHARAHRRVDDDGAPRVDGHTGRVETKALRVGCAARGEEQSVGPQFAAIGREHELAVDVVHPARLRVFEHRDALGAEGRRHGLADRRIVAEEQRVAPEHGHLAAQPREGLRKFDRHHRRPDHRQTRRDRVAGQRVGAHRNFKRPRGLVAGEPMPGLSSRAQPMRRGRPWTASTSHWAVAPATLTASSTLGDPCDTTAPRQGHAHSSSRGRFVRG